MENLGIAAFVVSLIFWVSPLAIPLGIYAIRKMTRRAAGAPRVMAYLAVMFGSLSTVVWGVIFLEALGRRSR